MRRRGGQSSEALLYEAVADQVERERMAEAGVTKQHPEDFYKLCASGSVEEVAAAIAGGVDPKIPDAARGQTTALHDAAAYNPDARVTALLLKKDVNINAQGTLSKRTALHLAVMFNPAAPAVIAEPAKGKPDYYLKYVEGMTPFHAALRGPVDLRTNSYRMPDERVMLALLDAEPGYGTPQGKFDPLLAYFRIFIGMSGNINPESHIPAPAVTERLLKIGCNPNRTTRGQGNVEQPLLFAAVGFDSSGMRRQDTLTRLLLQYNADVYALDQPGESVTHKAAFTATAEF